MKDSDANSSPRRGQILDAVVTYILKHGMTPLSLRPLAAHCNTSARLLIYHFGSKEALLAAAMSRLRDRIRDGYTALPTTPTSPGALLMDLWRLSIQPKNRASVILLFEILGLALRNPAPFQDYVQQSRASWAALIDAALPRAMSVVRRRELTTLAIATLDGMMLDYLLTNERHRTTQAMTLYTRQLDRQLQRLAA